MAVAAHVHLVAVALLSVYVISALSQEQQTNLEFYMHDNINVPNPSGIPVAGPNGITSTLTFGSIMVIDDALTEGPSPSSKEVGRGQGTYMFAQLDGTSLLLTFTAVFADKKGTLSFHGADQVTLPSREIAVVGGTGIYRFAQGYAVFSTVSSSGFSVVLHFNVTFRHSTEIKDSSSPSTSSSPGSGPPSVGDKTSSQVTSPSYCLLVALLALAGFLSVW